MASEGFQLQPCEVVEQIARQIREPGSHLSEFLDAYSHPDFDTGMMMVSDPVDRAVVTFVGSREQAERVYQAVRDLLA